jgi:hypothetical protein
MWRRTVDCLGIAVGIESRVPAIDALLAALLRSYADAPGSAAIQYVLSHAAWPQLARDGAVVARQDEDADLVPALELDLYTQVIARVPGLPLHAGAVAGADGRALVVAGRSGSGKSTLVRALLARGLSYLSEECVMLGPGSMCMGLARALHIDSGEASLPPGFTIEPYPLRGLARAPWLAHPPSSAIWRGTARAAAVIALHHGPDAPGTLEPLNGGAALAALWPAVLRPDATAIADAAAVLAHVPAYRLSTRRPEHALDLVAALAAELAIVPAR